jgi:hypothetical protein
VTAEVGRGVLAARLALGTTAPVDLPIGGGSARLDLATARLDGCVVRPGSVLSPAACLGVSYGRLTAEGRDFDVPRRASLGALAVSGELSLRLALGDVAALRLAGRVERWLAERVIAVVAPNGALAFSRSLPATGAALSLGVELPLP